MQHGGDLTALKARYGDFADGWVDLSTGINPVPYPFVPPSLEAWQRLPQAEAEARTIAAARSAYGVAVNADIVAAPGTQILIQLCARLRPGGHVAIVGPTYSEHAIAWRREGATVTEVGELADAANFGGDVVVVVNPNNPDGRSYDPDVLSDLADQMAARGGLLIVDEAFADVCPEVSLRARAGRSGLIVLRSFGKFYGLAGVRLGFAVGAADEIARVRGWLGPWAVAGPALEIGFRALGDPAWQDGARARIGQDCTRLKSVLEESGFTVLGSAGLFVLASHAQAGHVAEALAAQGIVVRVFAQQPTWLRFGLPAPEQFARVAAALASAARR